MFGLAFALATTPGGTAGGTDGGMTAFQRLVPLIYLFGIFYFLRIRPQKKKALEHEALLESIKNGDDIITSDGVHGKVYALENDNVILEVANSVNIKISKTFIAALRRD